MTARYKPYPEYKPSCIEWTAQMPEGWIIKKFKYFAMVQNGRDYKEVEIEEEGVPVIGSGGRFAWASRYLYRGESVLLGRKGTIDKPLYVNGSFWTVDTMFYTHVRKSSSAKFLYYCSLTFPFSFYSTNTAVPSMTGGDIENHHLLCPPLPEQRAIAAFLDRETGKIDRMIGKQERMIELLKEKRQAVISHAVTKGLNPTAPMKDSGIEWLGEIPEHWKCLRIAALYSESSEVDAPELPILSVSIHSGVSDKELSNEEADRKVSRSENRSLYKVVRSNDLTYNMMRAWQGGIGAVPVDGIVSPAYTVARPLHEINSKFVELLLRTPYGVEEMRKYSRGITDFRLRLYWDEFRSIRLSIPPVDEQNTILKFIEIETAKIDHLIAKAEQAIELMKERRTALISAAVTGKIDVRGAVEYEACEEPVLMAAEEQSEYKREVRIRE